MAHRLPLVCASAERRHVGEPELCSRDGRPRAVRPQRQPECGGSQSVRTTESGGPRGYDAGKRVWGRKRHTLVDTDGRPLTLQAGPASVQDRDGAVSLLKASRHLYPFIKRAFADSGYSGERVAAATIIAIEIVRKQAGQVGFAVQPRRRVVERTFAWLGRNRRLARDFEATIASATAFLYAASVMLLTRQLGRPYEFRDGPLRSAG